MTVPRIADITGDWLARVVGTPSDAVVTTRPIGAGQVARCHRVSVEAPGVRRSFIAKSPSADDTSRATAVFQRLYLREVSFYRELADLVDTRTPVCHYAELDDDGDFLLLLEDLTPASEVDQFEGLTVHRAREGLRQLAALHASTLGRTDLHDATWLRGTAEALRPVYEAIVPDLFAQFLTRYGDDLEPVTRQVVAGLGERLRDYSAYDTPHPVVQHGDFRTDNLLFDGRDGEVALAVVDWQTVSVGSPLLDVAFFLVTSLAEDDLARLDEELLDDYLTEMARRGAPLDAAVARAEFARYTLQPVLMLVAASMIVERTERGDRMFLMMIRRGVTASTRWRALERLEGDAAARG